VLLLVLILVLIAFGLLVVALLSGSVLWAWVSVGVSVAAAAVLLVDWLQRRSAVKAGAAAGDAVPTPAAAPVPPPHSLARESAVEPATEIIPAIRSDAPYGGPASGASEPVDGRHDERPDTRETVVLRKFPPPGSAGQPSGAPDGIGASGPNSSQSVTSGGQEPHGPETQGGPPGTPESDGHDAASPGADPDSEVTVKVAGATAREPAGRDAPPTGAPPTGVPPTGGGALPLRGGPEGPGGPPADVRPNLPPLGPDGAPPEEPRDADAAALVAELDDEVLVVDELPRYHLGGCRSLAGSPVIPLPAREAVELGFTPCAWCTPDRALSSRHRAAAR
jgi:hypothetical protein